MRRAVELEIRLSYYDRIVKTLPESFHGEEAQTLPTEAPSSEFEFELPCTSFVVIFYINTS